MADSTLPRQLASSPLVLLTLRLAISTHSSKCGNGYDTTSIEALSAGDSMLGWIYQLDPIRIEDDIHQEFKCPMDPYQLALYTDASHATCPIARRSPGGRCVALGGTAYIAKAKLLPVLATSITEAELMEGVLGSKDIIYQRSVVAGLGFQQQGPTNVHIDNAATLGIANAQRPTQRTRHMDIRWFAMQYWVQLGLIVLEHIPGIHNIADVFTKVLGWVLHARHTNQLMGYNGSPCYRPEQNVHKSCTLGTQLLVVLHYIHLYHSSS